VDINLNVRRDGYDCEHRDERCQRGCNDTVKRVLRMPVAQVDRLRRLERGAIMIDGGSVRVMRSHAVVMSVCMVCGRVVLVACQFVAMDVEVIAAGVLVEDQPLARHGGAGGEQQHCHRREPAEAKAPAPHEPTSTTISH